MILIPQGKPIHLFEIQKNALLMIKTRGGIAKFVYEILNQTFLAKILFLNFHNSRPNSQPVGSEFQASSTLSKISAIELAF